DIQSETLRAVPPQFTMRLRDRRIQVSYPVRLTCQVTGIPAPIITWSKDHEKLHEDDRHRFWTEDHFQTLEIAKTYLEDSGVYCVTAANEHGSVTCRCNLVVDKGIRAYVAPEFNIPIEPLD
ncbi:Immunoglobulin, partial [Oryctes borbonicus]